MYYTFSLHRLTYEGNENRNILLNLRSALNPLHFRFMLNVIYCNRNLPNWINVKQKNWNGEQEESPEEVQLRNTRESQILTGNLGDVLIPRHEILSDVSQLKLLAHLQESMVGIIFFIFHVYEC